MWFVFSLVCILGWGFADLFYKKGTEEDDPLSHLKIAVWVGLVMGVCALCLIPFAESPLSAVSILKYAPASVSYIVSMVIGYAGLRYLELSIVSPVQNASGALSTVCMVVWFAAAGRFGGISEEFAPLDLMGTAFIVLGVIALAAAEQRASRQSAGVQDAKYRHGALALLFPLFYCLFDTVGTAADGIILDGEAGLGLGEIDVLVLYGLSFLFAGLCAELWMLCKTKKLYNPFARSEKSKAVAAVCEEFGQVFYIFAMSAKPLLAAPMVASYCIVSIVLSRFLLREKLTRMQYLCIFSVVCGILLLGISEGLAA